MTFGFAFAALSLSFSPPLVQIHAIHLLTGIDVSNDDQRDMNLFLSHDAKFL
jgi:hypothetical protein